jgi:putative transcriptional regulator
MRISYKPLWKMLLDRDMTKKDLREQSGISTTSLAKLGKGENITTDVLLKICEALNCNINEIMESEPEPGDEKKVLDTDPVDVEQKSDTESVKQ